MNLNNTNLTEEKVSKLNILELLRELLIENDKYKKYTAEIAKKCDIATAPLLAFMRGINKPNATTIAKLMDHFKIKLDLSEMVAVDTSLYTSKVRQIKQQEELCNV